MTKRLTYREMTDGLTCRRCGHHWRPRKPERPRRCPSDDCKSTYWDNEFTDTARRSRKKRARRAAKP